MFKRLSLIKFRYKILIGLFIPILPMLAVVYITYYSTLNTAENVKQIVKLICHNSSKEINEFIKTREDVFLEWIKEDIYGMAIEFQAIDELKNHFESMLKGHHGFCFLVLTDVDGKIIESAVPSYLHGVNTDHFKGTIINEVSMIQPHDRRFAALVKNDLIKQIGKQIDYTFVFAFKTQDSKGTFNGFFFAYMDWSILDEKIKTLYKELKNYGFATSKIAIIDKNSSIALSHSQPGIAGSQIESEGSFKYWLNRGAGYGEFVEMEVLDYTYFVTFFPIQINSMMLGKDSMSYIDSNLILTAFVTKDTIMYDVRRILLASGGTTLLGIFIVIVFGIIITHSVTKHLGSAISEINTASEELKIAAKQQLTNSAEQVTSTTQLYTSMEEQVSSARQISDIARNVVSAAEETDDSANDGKSFLEKAVDGMETIKKQVENIVENMLALGEKSNQMTLALDIINELSAQTTILSYNATIEAAGAGEAGKRFAALAEQIMKLANRAGDSTKEIVIFIEDIQKSGNKTVLATEDGIKAVNEGMSRIQKTVQNFNHILTSSEQNLISAKEIEMTLSQQTAAIEQAAAVIKNIQMSAEDVKVSSEQTLKTAEQLFEMATNLSKI